MRPKSKTAPSPSSVIVELYDWWRSELASWFGRPNNARENRPSVSPPDIRIERGTIYVRGSAVPFETTEHSELIKSLRKNRASRRGVHIQLASDRFIVRPLAASQIPTARAYQMAELDIAAHTPFAIDDVRILFLRDQNSYGQTEYVLLRRDLIDPLLVELQRSGHPITALSFDGPNGVKFLDPRAVEQFNGSGYRLVKFVRKQFFPIAVLAAAAIIVWHVTASVQAALTEVTQEIEKAEPIANKARATLKLQASVLSQLRQIDRDTEQYVPAARMVEELTRIIPDDTYLTDLSLRNQKLQITGFSKSAAGLIAIIDASPLFNSPRFTTAVLRVPGRNGEQFNIELEFEHAG